VSDVTHANICLIGMPGAGKSTVGVLLAKAMSWAFLDTDVLIQAAEKRRLREIIAAEGIDGFVQLEERYVLQIGCHQHVIATGGSVVYGPAAMRHLKALGVVVHLDLPLSLLESRLLDFGARGVVASGGQTLGDLYRQRQPLYQQYADVTIDCTGRNHEQVVHAILAALRFDAASG
jgi:shikimate kinase